jgi:hypothetical protein
MRVVGKLYPGIYETGSEKQGATLGTITGLVTDATRTVAYGGFHYRTPFTSEVTTSRVLQLPPQGCDDLMGASESNPIPVGFLLIMGANSKPFLRRYVPDGN